MPGPVGPPNLRAPWPAIPDRAGTETHCLADDAHSVLPARAVGHYDADEARVAASALFAAREPPDAIFCANDHMAFATIETARVEFGLEVGRDVSVVGFDDVPLAAWPSFLLTTYSQPIQPMVRRVVEITLGHLEPGGAPVRATVPGTW